MKIEDSRRIENEKDLFDILIILWENKWQIISFLMISLVLGASIYFYLSIGTPTKYESSINLLVEDNPYYASDDVIHSEAKIIQRMNILLSSSNNYEKWSKDNISIIKHFSQADTSGLTIVDSTQTLNIEHFSQEFLDALASYLSYTAERLSNKIYFEMEYDLAREKNFKDLINQARSHEKMEIKEDIQKATMGLLTAQETLEQSSEEILLKKLMLLHTIEVNRLIIEYSNKALLHAETQYILQLGEVNSKILELEDKMQSEIQIVRLGNITSREINDNNSFIVIFLFSLFVGLIMGISYVLVRTEYIKRKENIK